MYKCGPNLQKYMKKKEIPEHVYFEAVSDSPITDADDAPGAMEAEEEDPIKGVKGPMKRKAGQ